MKNLSRVAVLLVALPLLAGACKHKKPPVVAPQTAGPGPTQPTNPPATTTERPAVPAANPNDPAKIAAVRALLLQTVYFDYDSPDIRADARTMLESKLPALNANPQLRLRIAGHCDERGTDEYNIALGRQRAEAVKRFLTDRGIDASRIETVSFGRERPAVPGSSEDAWAKNRRGEFEITAGGDQIKAP